jgi:hypothetical protein
MTTPICCALCTFWKKHREQQCNWGSCTLVAKQPREPNPPDSHLTKVYFHNPQNAEGVELHTHERFFCAEFLHKHVDPKPTVVDAAREAARKFTQQKEQKDGNA